MSDNSQPSVDLEIEIMATDSHYVATCGAFPGLVGAGSSEEEAKLALVHSLQLRLTGQPVEEPFHRPAPKAGATGWAKYVALAVVMISIAYAFVLWQRGHSPFEPKNGLPPEESRINDVVSKETQKQSKPSEPPASVAKRHSAAPVPSQEPEATAKTGEASTKSSVNSKKPVIVNYDQVFRSASEFYLPSIAILRRHALKGIATAQVCYARLLKSWGYDLEASAWANKLAPVADKQSVEFLVHFNQLCFDLQQLDPIPDDERIWRNPDEVKSIQLLKQAAQKGSPIAAYELGEIYRNYAGYLMRGRWKEPSESQLAEYAAEALQWNEQAVTKWQRDGKDDAYCLGMLAQRVNDLAKVAGTQLPEMLQPKALFEMAAALGGPVEAWQYANVLQSGDWFPKDTSPVNKWQGIAMNRAEALCVEGTEAQKHSFALSVIPGGSEWSRVKNQLFSIPSVQSSPLWIWNSFAHRVEEKSKPVGNHVAKPLGELSQETAVAIRAASEAIGHGTKAHDELLSISRQIMAGFLYRVVYSNFFSDEESAYKIRVQLLEAAAKLGHIEAAYYRGWFEKPSSNSNSQKPPVWAHDVEEKWYRIAASTGHVQAQVALALLLDEKSNFLENEAKSSQNPILDNKIANGRRKNLISQIEEESHQWFLRAAKQNCRKAQLALCNRVDEDLLLERPQRLQTESYMWGLIARRARQLHEYDFMREPDQLSPFASFPSWDFYIKAGEILVDVERAKESAKSFVAKTEIVISLPNAPILNSGSGTGFFIAPRFIVTNAHVVDGWDVATIEDSTGQHMTAKVESLDEKNDLAVLSVETNMSQSFLILRIEGAELAEEVFTIGFPNPEIQGTNAKYTDGKISSDSGINDDRRFYQTTVPVQPGNSGGPLVNSDGQVIGVMTSRLSDMGMLRASGSLPQNVSYAIKADYLNPLLRGLAGESFSNQRLVSDKQERSALVRRLRSAVVRVLVGQE